MANALRGLVTKLADRNTSPTTRAQATVNGERQRVGPTMRHDGGLTTRNREVVPGERDYDPLCVVTAN